MLGTEITAETIRKAALLATKDALFNPEVRKTITTATGLTGIILETPAKQQVPFLSPFRQRIPRKTQPGSTAVQWKAITDVSMPKFSVAETAAANQNLYTVVPKSATYKEVGVGDGVTRKAIAEGTPFEDVKARGVNNVLLNAQRMEEIAILGGNITALAAPAAPAVVVVDAGGTVPAAAGGYDVRIRAITLFASNRVTPDRPAAFGSAAAPINVDSPLAGNGRAGVNPDTATDGWSAQGALTTSAAAAGGNDALRISWTAVPGAVAYGVYVIAAGGGPKLEAIVTQTTVTLTSLAGTGAAIVAGDTSADALIFDGMIPKILSDSSSYKKNLNGILTVTSGTKPSITELQDAFQNIWDRAKIGEFDILVGGTEQRTLVDRSLVGGGGPTIFVDAGDVANRVDLLQGYHVGFVVNSITGERCPVQTLPWLPGGMILILPRRIPFPTAEFEYPFEIAATYGWEQIDYAVAKADGPVQNFEVREDAVLKDYFPAGCGIIYNVVWG